MPPSKSCSNLVDLDADFTCEHAFWFANRLIRAKISELRKRTSWLWLGRRLQGISGQLKANWTSLKGIASMKKDRNWHPYGLRITTLVDAADVEGALVAAFHKNCPEPGDEAKANAAADLDIAAWILLRRLAFPRIGDLEQIRRDLQNIAKHVERILELVRPKLTAFNDVGEVERVISVKAASTPFVKVMSSVALLTPLVLALESGAQAAGFERPDQALDEALTSVANLLCWAIAAQVSFAGGRRNAQDHAYSQLADPLSNKSGILRTGLLKTQTFYAQGRQTKQRRHLEKHRRPAQSVPVRRMPAIPC